MYRSRSRDTSADTPHARTSSRAFAGPVFRDSSSESDELHLAQLLVDRSDEFILWFDAEARLLYGNPAICRALGYQQSEFSTLRMSDIAPLTPDIWPARWGELKQHLSQNFEAELRTRSGEIIPVQFNANYVGGKEFVLCFGRDLRQPPPAPPPASEDAIFVMREGQVEDSEGEAPELFGGSRRQIIGELQSLLGEPGSLGDAAARALAGNEVVFDWHSRRPDGSRVQIECTLSRIELEGNVRLLAVAVDVTGPRQPPSTLAQLSGRLLEMQDEERRRIARELHDSTGQNLGALSIGLSMLLSTLAIDSRTRDAIQESVALADSCIREIRTMSYLLHPPLLDELGLTSGLRAYADGYSERTGIQLALDLPSHMPRLPQAIEIALFRIAQEGLANIHRHSGSRTAHLRLKQEPDHVELETVDFGHGLTSASRIGVGIAGMRERARQLGGRLTIASSETGTTLHVFLPLSHSQQFDTAVGRP